MTRIPALTILQPWAWAIVEGHKSIENRSWPTTYRGPLAIHAGKARSWMKEGTQLIESLGLELPADLPFRHLVGVVELVDCVQLHLSPELNADPFASGPWCWKLAAPRKLAEPISIRGHQCLWYLEEQVADDLLSHSREPKRARRSIA